MNQSIIDARYQAALDRAYLAKLKKGYDPHGYLLEGRRIVHAATVQMINDGYSLARMYELVDQARASWNLEQINREEPHDQTIVELLVAIKTELPDQPIEVPEIPWGMDHSYERDDRDPTYWRTNQTELQQELHAGDDDRRTYTIDDYDLGGDDDPYGPAWIDQPEYD
jgi:hypothetical protein